MPVPSILGLLDAIAADLRSRLPDLRDECNVHDGRWNIEEVKRWAVRSPALLVACTGVSRTETPGERWTDADLQLGIFVLTGDKPALPRGRAALALVDWLLLYVPRARWGVAPLGEAVGLQAANHFDADLDKLGVALWAVTWRQELRLEAAADGTCPPLPTELYASEQDDPHELLHPEAE